MAERIGVYVCECGPNIKDAVNIDEIINFVKKNPDVVFIKSFRLLCSPDGQKLIEEDIQHNNLTRIVIAACSPKEHEITFMKVLKKAGINPFFLQIANIREQCAWVVKDKVLATEKAKKIINAALYRVVYQEPLEVKEVECVNSVLVIGAGVAGMSAALTLANAGRKVYLIEKTPVIGGKVSRYDEVFSNLECATCMLDPKMDEVLHKENIELLTLAEVQDVVGFFGNFIVKIRKRPRFVDIKGCIGCGVCFGVCPVQVKNEFNENLNERKAIYIPYPGALPNAAVIDEEHCLRFQGKDCDACQKACPFGSINYEEVNQIIELNVGAVILATGFGLFDLKNIPQYGYGKIEEVYTSLEFERLLSSTGPTAGSLVLKNGIVPKKIIFVYCAGSRSDKYKEHCSAVCCQYLIKFMHLSKKRLPQVSVAGIYCDFCLPGKEAQGFFNKIAAAEKIEFFQRKDSDSLEIIKEDSQVSIKFTDKQGVIQKVVGDMVVLAPAVCGDQGNAELAKIFDINQDKNGFFIEEHAKLSPVSTASEGIFITGCSQSPQDIPNSVASAQAAAGIILSKLIPGKRLTLEVKIAEVNKDICSGCKTCIVLCPFKAISYDQTKKQSVVNEVLCRGCGTCAAACPSSAIKAKHFTDKQISEEIKGLLK